MPVDFFDRELKRVQLMFNQTFGNTPLANPGVRTKTIFAILHMGLLQRQISDNNRKEDISRFVKTRDRLDQIFSVISEDIERKKTKENQTNKNTFSHSNTYSAYRSEAN